MINIFEVNETNKMIDPGKSGCAYHHHGHQPAGLYRSDDLIQLNQNVYEKITTICQGSGIHWKSKSKANYGIPIVNKRISVTPIALIGERGLQDSRRIM